MKHTSLELYRALNLLTNFRELNEYTFTKILKKHDKYSEWTDSLDCYLPRIKKYPLYSQQRLDFACKRLQVILLTFPNPKKTIKDDPHKLLREREQEKGEEENQCYTP